MERERSLSGHGSIVVRGRRDASAALRLALAEGFSEGVDGAVYGTALRADDVEGSLAQPGAFCGIRK